MHKVIPPRKEPAVSESGHFLDFLTKPRTNDSSIAGVLTLAFAAVLLLIILNHEMWQDEMQCWAVAISSSSIADLFRNFRYDGHPILWYLSLYLISRVVSQPVAFQFFNWALAVASVFVMARYSPFPRWMKALLAFGYFPLYEYGTISRNYGMGILLLFMACALLGRGRNRNYPALAAVLFLMMQTNAYATIIAVSIALTLALEYALSPDLRTAASGKGLQIALSAGVLLLGFVLFVLQSYPPPDSAFSGGWHFGLDPQMAEKAIGTIWRSYVSFPQISYQFWNTNILENQGAAGALSILLLVGAIAIVRKQRTALVFYCTATFGVLAFTYLRNYGFMRHHGHLFMILIASLWLLGEEEKTTEQKPRVSIWKWFAGALLAVQLAAGVYAGAADWLYPFSESAEVSEFIVSHHLEGMTMMGSYRCAVVPIAARLRKKIYYPEERRFSILSQLKRDYAYYPTPSELGSAAQSFCRERGEPVLLISTIPIDTNAFPSQRIGVFISSIEIHDRYLLYLFRP